MSIPFGFGLRMILDGHQRFTRSSIKTYLIVKNFIETQGLQDDGTFGDFIELGVPFAPSGAAAISTGTSSILIDQPPSVMPVSTRDIGIFGEKLNFGSKYFYISHTFIKAQMQELGLADGREIDVFRNRGGPPNGKCVGIYYDGTLYDPVKLMPRVVGGEFINWQILGNAFTEFHDFTFDAPEGVV